MSSEAPVNTPIEQKYQNQFVTLSNSVIRAREFTNLLESKIEILAIHNMDVDMKQREKTDANGESYSVSYVMLKAAEIKELMGRTDGDVYNDIKDASIALKQKILIIEDKEQKRYLLKSMYSDIAYANGQLYVEFEPSMQDYFLNLKENFTKLQLPILFSFEKNGGLQLYKLLRSYVYSPNLPGIDMSVTQEELPEYAVSFDLPDLRMLLGYVDIRQDALRREGNKKRPNWQKMVDEEKHQKYRRWSDFSVRVIEPGIKEINEKSDIYISRMEKITSGRGGKVSGLTFCIQHNKAYHARHDVVKPGSAQTQTRTETNGKVLSEAEMDDLIDELREIIKEPVKTKDLKALAKASGYDPERVRAAYAAAEDYPKEISNLVAFLLKAMQENYTVPVKKKPSAQGKRNSFRDYPQTQYDFDEISALISNH